ncbi:hypothetical protein ACJ6WD_10820 [Streptomyces sp. VTCC 41912]|uniref:hypothetical protein n=1 Tax=Streptomyces sp. VTCC 41912 TaxID=3383243 RepID=UPI003896BD7D
MTTKKPHFRFDCSGCRDLERQLDKARSAKDWDKFNELDLKRKEHLQRVEPDLKQSKQKAIRMYRSGVTLSELAEKMGVSLVKMREIFKEWGEPRRRRERVSYSPSAKEKMVSDYRAGVSAHEIARRYGGSHTTVLKRLREWGVPMRSRSEAGMAGRYRDC